MENNHKLGLYVSYYLSRFDEEAYKNLGFGNQSETHNRIGDLLSVKPHTVKNWRDEFDPLFGHRAGWYQRPMSPSRIKVAQALESLDEQQIQEIVRDILTGKLNEQTENEDLLLSIASEKNRDNSNKHFILRGPTGKAAEEYFQKQYSEKKKPINGKLIDCRELGSGYDFKIEADEEFYVEVKGISETSGGILFTDKEWITAKVKGENYFLCIISNLKEDAQIIYIQNPAKNLKAQKNIYTSIQISWSVTQNQISNADARLF